MTRTIESFQILTAIIIINASVNRLWQKSTYFSIQKYYSVTKSKLYFFFIEVISEVGNCSTQQSRENNIRVEFHSSDTITLE